MEHLLIAVVKLLLTFLFNNLYALYLKDGEETENPYYLAGSFKVSAMQLLSKTHSLVGPVVYTDMQF